MKQSPCVTHSAGPSAQEWELYRPKISRLYLDDNMPLPEVIRIMQSEHMFKASIKMYKSHFKSWKIDRKNLRRGEVKHMAQVATTRAAVGKRSAFQTRGKNVTEQNLKRYVQKRGFSTLLEYIEATPICADGNEITCYTPITSPHTPTVPLSSPAAITHMFCGGEADNCAITTRANHHQLSQIQKHSSTLLQKQSWRMLSPGAVPRRLAQPSTLRMHEHALWCTDAFLNGKFDGGFWFLDSKALLQSQKTPTERADQTWSNCKAASRFIANREYVQARQLLSKVCTTVESQIRNDDTAFLVDLLTLLDTTQLHIRLDVQAVILRHCALSGRHLLGEKHPLTRLLRLLSLNLTDQNPNIYVHLLQLEIDTLAKHIGLLHRATIYRQLSLIERVDPAEAVTLGRRLYENVPRGQGPEYTTHFYVVATLAEALHRNNESSGARDVLLKSLQDFDAAPAGMQAYLVKHIILHQILHLLSEVLFAMSDLVGAEQYSRLCLTSAEDQLKPNGPDHFMFLNHRVTVLRGLGRIADAEEVEATIRQLLGPPEIPELLG